MKKILIATMLSLSIMLASCGKPMVYEGKEYPTYGFLNSNSYKSENMCYEVSVGNVVWSVILASTIVMPTYFVGFSIFNPVGPKSEKGCGIDNQ